MRNVPVVLFVFNRPEHLDRVLGQLRKNKIPKLYVFCDGARGVVDVESVKAVRQIIHAIDWVELEIFEADENKGLSPSIINGLNMLFKRHEQLIVAEDDIVVSPGFYDYMTKTLDHYKGEKGLAGITGLCYPIGEKVLQQSQYDTYIQRRFCSWGWATWRHAWQEFEFDPKALSKKYHAIHDETHGLAGEDLAMMAPMALSGELGGSWDVLISINMLIQKKSFVWPTTNYVENEGIGTGSHPGEKPSWGLKWGNASSATPSYAPVDHVDKRLNEAFINFFRAENVMAKPSLQARSMRIVKNAFKKLGSSFQSNDNKLQFNKYLSGEVTGRALLSYLREPLYQEIKGIPTIQFSNNGAGRTWGKVLNELGYEVDAINWDDTEFTPNEQYDLIVLHGGKNYKNLASALKPGGKLVYYSTGSYWKYHNDQEALRFKQFTDRTGHILIQDRHIGDDEEAINRQADAIISLGNKDTAATYADFPSVHSLEGAGYDVAEIFERNLEESRRHFLFLSGPGNIHKGLDLVIEAFRSLPDLHLHIVTTLNTDFEEYYHDDLHESQNIHTYGFVPQRSKYFYSIIQQCSYSILLSCSEGSPGSVIESMQQGLIPIITKASHIDLPSSGVVVKDLGVESLQKIITNASSMDVASLQESIEQVKKYVANVLSVENFEENLKKIINQIVAQKTDS